MIVSLDMTTTFRRAVATAALAAAAMAAATPVAIAQTHEVDNATGNQHTRSRGGDPVTALLTSLLSLDLNKLDSLTKGLEGGLSGKHEDIFDRPTVHGH
ncbi:hypothetical protein ACFV9E_41850 [Streptomyces sp. NPDC059835]|uniref:hypothetical protein n=1 Tax=Streptomyces sp. NPDC059835 TaxID=3346967 RepID=UPI00364B1FAA